MAAHAAEHGLDQGGTFTGAGTGHGAGETGRHLFRIVAVDGFGGDAVTDAAIGEFFAGELVAGGGGKRVPIVFDHQDERQLPHRGHVEAFVEITGRGAAVADEIDGDAVAARLFEREGGAGRHRDHRAEVADHADVADAVFGVEVTIVERTFDAGRKTVGAAEQLAGQAVEQVFRLGPQAVAFAETETGEGAGRVEVISEDGAEVAVQRTKYIAVRQREAGGRGGRFTADLAVPLGEAAGFEQEGEARVEIARELHEGVLEQALAGGAWHGLYGGFCRTKRWGLAG